MTKVKANINDEKKVITVKEFLEYKFSDAELKEFSQQLARGTQEVISLENEKKANASNFKAKIDGKVAENELIAQKINNEREHRYIDCELQLNSPKNGKKTLVRLDTAEIVWEKNMTAEELQMQLDFDNEQRISSASVVHNMGDNEKD